MEFHQFHGTFTATRTSLYKKAIILLTFLAYALTLIHSVVPHHHHEERSTNHHHHHGEGMKHHHDHDDDHDDDDHDRNTISHVFADAIHHPASEISVHASEFKVIQKKNTAVDILIVELIDLVSPKLKPPDAQSIYQEKHHSFARDYFFLLRAPPAA